MVISPYTGFNSPFDTEADALRFIRSELVKYENGTETTWKKWQDLNKAKKA